MSDPIADFLANYPPDMQAITQRLRQLVNDEILRGQEVLYADQNHIGYSFSGKASERILYICPLQKYVRLGFMRGTLLPDPQQLLVGEGKWLRHIKIKTLEQANAPAVRALVKAAWDYGLGERKSQN
jgi:hypothetical protein